MSQRRRKGFLAEIGRSLQRIGVPRGASMLAALSGGPDSVALLYALAELREEFSFRLAAAHLNHGLRGDESNRDESFCRELCERMNIDLIVERATSLTPGMANLEEAARDVRRDFMKRSADRIGADFIALGHHSDDQAETVLMRLLRGAGTAGLSAMAECGPGRIIRPMLALSRRDILDYLDAVGAGYVTDASNKNDSILRNRLRNQLLPLLERDYVPGASQRLAALATEMRAVDSFLCRAAAAELSQMLASDEKLNLVRFAGIDAALRAPLLRLYLAREMGSLRRLSRDHFGALVDLCVEGPANGEISLPGRWRAVREYDKLFVVHNPVPKAAPRFLVPLPFEGATVIEEAGFVFDVTVIGRADATMPGDHWSAIFDAEAVSGGDFLARNLRAGDRVRPLGLDGTRKVKDVLIDRKVPHSERTSLPIVILNDVILWLPGVLRADAALVRSSTESVLRVEARRISDS